MNWKLLEAFWHSYIPLIFFLKSFSWCKKFPIHEFFGSDVLWKLFDIGFPYKHCYFEPVCLLVKMASKTVIRPIREFAKENLVKQRDWLVSTHEEPSVTITFLNDSICFFVCVAKFWKCFFKNTPYLGHFEPGFDTDTLTYQGWLAGVLKGCTVINLQETLTGKLYWSVLCNSKY